MSPRSELGGLFLRSAVRGLGGVAAMATLPLMQRAVTNGATGAKHVIVVARDHACALKHGIREYRAVRRTLAKSRRYQQKKAPPP